MKKGMNSEDMRYEADILRQNIYSRLACAMEDLKLGRTQDADSVFNDILDELDKLD